MTPVETIKALIQKHGLNGFLTGTVTALEDIQHDLADKGLTQGYARITRDAIGTEWPHGSSTVPANP